MILLCLSYTLSVEHRTTIRAALRAEDDDVLFSENRTLSLANESRYGQ